MGCRRGVLPCVMFLNLSLHTATSDTSVVIVFTFPCSRWFAFLSSRPMNPTSKRCCVYLSMAVSMFQYLQSFNEIFWFIYIFWRETCEKLTGKSHFDICEFSWECGVRSRESWWLISISEIWAVMADVQDTRNALWRRDEQLRRWNLSETFSESSERKNKESKIKFHDGCVFLAACSSGDTEEVEKLLAKGADINTANIDGLTALHQVCQSL